jgi:hypothetical protein
LDSNPILTKLESEYFNNEFKNHNATIDFTKMKIGFFSGPSGDRIRSKKDYFDSVKNRLGGCNHASQDYIIALTNEEKIESGGYDLIIVSWSKIIPTDKERMIQELRKNP